MGPVIYSMSVSLDGFIAGPDGDIGWGSAGPRTDAGSTTADARNRRAPARAEAV